MKSVIRTLGVLVGISGLTASVACSSIAGDDAESGDQAISQAQLDGLFDVNDVSILFAQDKSGGIYPSIAATGNLFPEKTFKDLEAFAGTNEMPLPAASKWKVVGLRFDPCAPGLSDEAIQASPTKKCVMQLRLIAQPFEGKRDLDFTAHLMFNLGLEDKAKLAENPVIMGAMAKLAAIKAASTAAGANTAGMPLGPHPGLTSEATKGGNRVASLVQDLVETFTKTPSRGIAFMGLQNGGPEPWRFFTGRVDAAGSWTPLALPVSPAKQIQTLSFIDAETISPPGPAISTTPLFESGDVTPAKEALAFKVEDAATQHVFNTDCVSCHTSSAQQHGNSFGGAIGSGKIPGRVPVPKNITGYVTKANAQDSSWNVRNFGYFEGKPTVSGRTVTETVEVVAFMNAKVVGPALKVSDAIPNGPGKDCSAVDEDVFRCLRDGDDKCFAKCKASPAATDVDKRAPDPTPRGPEPDDTNANEPCAKVNANAEASVELTKEGSTVVAKLKGNNQLCLSRVVAGSFTSRDKKLKIRCRATKSTCTVTVAGGTGRLDQVALTGTEATRFQTFLRTNGKDFKSRGEGAGVSIGCNATTCTVSVATDRAELPHSGALINPN